MLLYSPNADVTVITACIAFLINFKLRLCHKDDRQFLKKLIGFAGQGKVSF
jgi:hypothetical protein